MSAPSTDYESVLEIIQHWPPARRFTLVQDVLKTLAPPEQNEVRSSTLDQALGLLSKGHTPSDQDIARWLDERRTERFGK